jgi:5-(carboxyamino)imidazole ribonucleotide synthase
VLKPGATIGILGGGQLARMLALAAAPLGLKCHVYSPEKDSCAFDVVHAGTVADYENETALAGFAKAVDVVTYEFENVPAKTAALLSSRVRVLPDPHVLETTQDRLIEKTFVADLKIATAPYAAVHSATQLAEGLEKVGVPAVLKTTRLGYDGKGQRKIESASEANEAWRSLKNVPCILEGFVKFQREVSVIAARATDGAVECFEVTENEHRDHILHISRVPAKVTPALRAEAKRVASKIVNAFGYVGVMGVEMFVVRKARAARSGQRACPARAQFRALDDRRRDDLAIRAAHPRGGRLAARQAEAARRESRNDKSDRRRNSAARALADGAEYGIAHVWQGQAQPAPQDGACDARVARLRLILRSIA